MLICHYIQIHYIQIHNLKTSFKTVRCRKNKWDSKWRMKAEESFYSIIKLCTFVFSEPIFLTKKSRQRVIFTPTFHQYLKICICLPLKTSCFFTTEFLPRTEPKYPVKFLVKKQNSFWQNSLFKITLNWK